MLDGAAVGLKLSGFYQMHLNLAFDSMIERYLRCSLLQFFEIFLSIVCEFVSIFAG